jgi:hypothetical protein
MCYTVYVFIRLISIAVHECNRAGSVSVFQVGVGYRLFFRLFFQVGRFSVSVFIKISVSVSVFLRSTIYLIFKVISTACARPVGCMYMLTLYNSMSD